MTLDELVQKGKRSLTIVALALAGLGVAYAAESHLREPHEAAHHANTYPNPSLTGPRLDEKDRPVQVLGFTKRYALPDFSTARLAPLGANPRLDAYARLQRTERYENVIAAVEKKRHIPKDLLYALVMQESEGDPMLPNGIGDGGFGLVHFQPGTAHSYGLHTVPSENSTGRDVTGGKRIQEVLDYCRNDPDCVLRYDDRAQVVMVLDAAGKMLQDGHRGSGTWWGAVQSINPRSPAYPRAVFHWRGVREHDLRAAAADFDRRNAGKKVNGHPLTFAYYTGEAQKSNENYGLQRYIKGR